MTKAELLKQILKNQIILLTDMINEEPFEVSGDDIEERIKESRLILQKMPE